MTHFSPNFGEPSKSVLKLSKILQAGCSQAGFSDDALLIIVTCSGVYPNESLDQLGSDFSSRFRKGVRSPNQAPFPMDMGVQNLKAIRRHEPHTKHLSSPKLCGFWMLLVGGFPQVTPARASPHRSVQRRRRPRRPESELGSTRMQPKDQGSQRQIIEEVCKHLPHTLAAILPVALIEETSMSMSAARVQDPFTHLGGGNRLEGIPSEKVSR